MTLNVSGGRLEIKLHLQPPTFLQDQRDMKENQQKKPTKPLMFAETWCGNLENLLSNFKVFSFFLKNNKKLTENCEIYATFCTYRKRCQDCKTPRTVAPRYINSLISPKPFLSSPAALLWALWKPDWGCNHQLGFSQIQRLQVQLLFRKNIFTMTIGVGNNFLNKLDILGMGSGSPPRPALGTQSCQIEHF